MEATFPTRDVEYNILPDVPWNKPMRELGNAYEWRHGRQLIGLLNAKLLVWNSTHRPEERFHQILGVFPGGPRELISFCPGDQPTVSNNLPSSGLGRATYCWGGDDTSPHTIAHNFGLRHTNVSSAPCYAPDLHSYWQRSYLDNSIQDFGYNLELDQVVPKSTADLMSWDCAPTWLSPLHYSMLLNTKWIPQPAKPGEKPVTDPGYTPMSATDSPYLVVSGDVHSGGTVTFEPFWQITSPIPPENPLDGTDYCVELQDADDNVLASQCLDLHWTNYENDTASSYASFFTVLPLGTAAHSASGTRSVLDAGTKVVIKEGSTELQELVSSQNPPTVTLVAPNGGEALGDSVTVTWQASDADLDPLTSRLFYSVDDGLSWMQVTGDVTQSSATLDLSMFPASTSARLRVDVSDGFHTTRDTSDGAFTVPEKAPLVSILNPDDGSVLAEGFVLQGAAYDPDDGELSGASLVWSSSLDGSLGSGGSVQIDSLTLGEHVLTLSATDSAANTSQGAITVTFGISEPIAGLAATNDSPTPMGQTVHFEASVITGTDASYVWAFGDGGMGSGKSTVHVYELYGNYTAVVTATNSLNSQSTSTPVTITYPTIEYGNKVYLPVVTRNLE